MDIDTTAWSGEGAFTATLLEALQTIASIERLKVEDAPASRSEPGYAFISNEIYVTFQVASRRRPVRYLGLIPGSRRVETSAMTTVQLALALEAIESAGAPDYADDGMLQYLRTERIVPPYQTQGVKIVEMVRIYETGARRPD